MPILCVCEILQAFERYGPADSEPRDSPAKPQHTSNFSESLTHMLNSADKRTAVEPYLLILK